MAHRTFDIFDTLLTRAVAEPTALFLLLGRRLTQLGLIDVTPETFARARVEAERCARANTAGSEITFRQIHTELSISLRLEPEKVEDVMQQELAMEERLMRVVPGAVKQLQEVRQDGHSVLFLSDMYLPASFLNAQLVHYGLWKAGDHLYVSCEHGCGKHFGGLYAKVLREHGLRGTKVLHIGNDAYADVRQARRAGIQARHFSAGNLNRFEKTLAAHCWQSEGLSAAMAGASRLARLAATSASDREMALGEVAAGVAGPTLCGFALWVLEQARRRCLTRLYFLARDGQMIMEVARRLLPKLGFQCELRYLYASRQSFLLPSVTQIREFELKWMMTAPFPLTPRRALSRVSIAPEEVKDDLNAAGIPEDAWEMVMTEKEQSRLKRMLAGGALSERVLAKAAAKREVLVEYLRQEGLLRDGSWAVVDAGWGGSIQGAMGRVLRTAGGPTPIGFYFGLDTRRDGGDGGELAGYFFDRLAGTGYETQDRRSLVILFEIFCYADHGLVLEFARAEDGCVSPVLNDYPGRNALDEFGYEKVRQTVFRFAEDLVLDEDLLNWKADVRPAIDDLINKFWMKPTRREATAWGSFPFESDQSGSFLTPVASPYRPRHVLIALLRGKLPPRHATSWKAGSLLISAMPIRLAALIAAELPLNRILRRVLNQRLRARIQDGLRRTRLVRGLSTELVRSYSKPNA